jgi:hypothetical protein
MDAVLCMLDDYRVSVKVESVPLRSSSSSSSMMGNGRNSGPVNDY